MKIRGKAHGEMLVFGKEKKEVARIKTGIDGGTKEFSSTLDIADGVSPLYFTFRGKGKFDFLSFELK